MRMRNGSRLLFFWWIEFRTRFKTNLLLNVLQIGRGHFPDLQMSVASLL